jgi:ABC-type branched-subunit amino acid transport system substrate-binding protein
MKWLPAAVCLVASVTFNISFAEDILIGQSVGITGPVADIAKDLVVGSDIYFKYVNDNGGVFGRKIKHIVKDDHYKPADTPVVVKELIEKDNVVALIGSAGTAHLLGLLKTKEMANAGIAMIGPYSGSGVLRVPFADTRNIFHIRAGYEDEAEGIVDQLMALQLDKIALFYQDDAFGKVGLAAVTDALKKRGKTLVGFGTYKTAAPHDVDQAVKDIVKADPSAVIMWATNPATSDFIRKSRPISHIAQYVNISVVDPKTIYKLAGEKAARGVGISQVMPYPYSTSAPIVKEFLDVFKKYAPAGYGPNYTSLEGFIAAKTLVEGIKRGGPKVTRESVFKGLESLSAYDVGGFMVRFSPTNHAQSKFVEITVISKNGKLIR